MVSYLLRLISNIKITSNFSFHFPCIQSSSHSLSIEPPGNVHSTLRMEDLHHGDDNDDGKFQQYEKKIDTLMTQVGSLKSQVQSNFPILFHLSVTTMCTVPS